MFRRALVLLVLLMASLSLSPAVARSTTQSATANWLQYRSDNRRSGFNPSETQITPATVGSLRLKKIVGFPFDGPTPPLEYGNTLYTVGLSYWDPDGYPPGMVYTVYALNAQTGATRWTRSFDCDGGIPVGVPAISTTDKVLVIPFARACGSTTGNGSLYGLDTATGSVKWVAPVGPSPGIPAILGQTLYIRASQAGDPAEPTIMAFNTTGGGNLWVRFLKDVKYGSFGDPSVGGGIVYFGETIAGVPMLSAQAAGGFPPLWSTGSATGEPTLGAGRAYVDCDMGICSYDQSGHLVWSFAGGNGEMAFANGSVFVACSTNTLCALDGNTGALLWSTDMGPSPVTSITVAGGVVFAGTASSIETVNAASGEALGYFGPGMMTVDPFGRVLPNDPVVVNGHVYVVSENRIYIYSLP